VVAETQTVEVSFRRQAALRGTHPLLICDSDRISYADAERRSAELARGLTALGAGKGSHVGLLYPNGTERPLAANLNATAGQVVPNMVIGRLGADGKLAIFNYAGSTDVVADVMGYFTS